MNKIQTFQDFMTTVSIKVPVTTFIINFILAAILSIILGWLYSHYGRSLSNRKQFARNFPFMTVTTMLVICIVKSSLALSLGLVGALSIVRFRAAIKEPEELMYLFFTIAIGLGLGADQRVVTVVAFILTAIMIFISGKLHWRKAPHNLHLTLTSPCAKKTEIEEIVEKLEAHCNNVKLQRLDYEEDMLEACFLVELINFEDLVALKKALYSVDERIRFSFLDNRGLF